MTGCVVASSSYEARNEAAIERGYDSLYDQTRSRSEAKEYLEGLGGDYTRGDVWAVADFGNNFADGEWSQSDLREFFDEFIGGDDRDFYDWLESLYE